MDISLGSNVNKNENSRLKIWNNGVKLHDEPISFLKDQIYDNHVIYLPANNIGLQTYTIELDHPNFSILKSSGGWLLFNEGGMLLVNVGQDIVRAFSNSCPHQGCRTSWKYSNNNFTCTCHNAVFTNIGERVSGPAPSDLTSYTVVRDNDIITVTT